MACEYCKGERPIIVAPGLRVAIDSFRERLTVSYYDETWDFRATNIKYCPMCGERLGDDAS